MRSVKLKPLVREQARNSAINIDFAQADVDLADTTPVLVWVAHRTRRGGKLKKADNNEFNPGANIRTWADFKALTGASRQLTPRKKGKYTVILVAIVNGKPVTYRSAPIVVRN